MKRFFTLGAVGAALLSILGASMMLASSDKAEGDNNDKGREFTAQSIKPIFRYLQIRDIEGMIIHQTRYGIEV